VTAAVAITGALALFGSALRGADEKPATKTRQVKAGELALTVPEAWRRNSDVSGSRIAEFAVPPVGDDKESGEFVVFDFGPRGAGSVEDNIDRWVGQFDTAGRTVKTVTGESAQGKYTLVDLAGTYKKSIGPPIQKQTKSLSGWRVMSVIIESKGHPYYIKIDGPAKTITAIEDDFRSSFGAKKEGEKELKAK
jgi:gluconolactonase